MIDQSPIGRTPRSNPVTYIKAFDRFEGLFASTREAERRGYTPGHFSFNIPGGRCETLPGSMARSRWKCNSCRCRADLRRMQGHSLKSGTLEIRYNGLNITRFATYGARSIAFFHAARAWSSGPGGWTMWGSDTCGWDIGPPTLIRRRGAAA